MDSDNEDLLICCNEARPIGKAVRLVVKPSADNEFITIHDYLSGKSVLQELPTILMIVSAVHPWLMSLHGNILEAKSQQLRQCLPTEFIVSAQAPDRLKGEMVSGEEPDKSR